MSKKSNDSIEEFFKKGVRKSDITFRESDWQKMERMLDERAMVGSASPSRSLKRILGVVVIVALLSSIYFLIPDGDDKTSSTPENQTAVTSNKSEQAVLLSENQKSQPANETDKKVDKEVESASTNARVKEVTGSNQEKSSLATRSAEAIESSPSARSRSNVVVRNERSSERGVSDQSSSIPSSSNPITSAPLIAKQQATDNRPNLTTQASGSLLDVNNSSSKTSDQLKASNVKENDSPFVVTSSQTAERGDDRDDQKVVDTQSSQTTEQPVSATSSDQTSKLTSTPRADGSPIANNAGSSNNTIVKTDSTDIIKVDENPEQPVTTGSVVEEDKENKSIVPSRWSVAFVVAPEFSSTSLDKQTVPGSAYGLTIGYRVINRLTISTGVIKTYKKYVGYGEDYQPPAGYWQFRTNGIVPDEVSGQCSVIEVPLMLQYDIMQREKSRFYASAGASSYRMLNEKYAYTFNEPNDGAADGWSTDTPSSYYFSVGHVSLGYDHRLYRGLYLGVEPYVKIPFGGIGWSNVNLLTMGAYVNVKYRFSKRN